MATVYKRGDTSWERFSHDGQHIRRSARTTKKAEAQIVLHRLMEECRTTDGKAVARYRLPEAIDAFFESSSLKTSTLETYRVYSRPRCVCSDTCIWMRSTARLWANSPPASSSLLLDLLDALAHGETVAKL